MKFLIVEPSPLPIRIPPGPQIPVFKYEREKFLWGPRLEPGFLLSVQEYYTVLLPTQTRGQD